MESEKRTTQATVIDAVLGNLFPVKTQSALKTQPALVNVVGQFKLRSQLLCVLYTSLLVACSIDVDEPANEQTQVAPTTVTENSQMSPADAEPINSGSSDPIQPFGDTNGTPVSTPSVGVPVFDESGIAASDNDLARLLLNEFVLENQEFIPTTGWICTDALDEQRLYYFYQQGVLDANRSVVIERTLNVNATFDDITFFWSVTNNDSILMTSVNRNPDGSLLSSGRQFDVNSIRFQLVESVDTFTADSILRGRLVCGNFSFR